MTRVTSSIMSAGIAAAIRVVEHELCILENLSHALHMEVRKERTKADRLAAEESYTVAVIVALLEALILTDDMEEAIEKGDALQCLPNDSLIMKLLYRE